MYYCSPRNVVNVGVDVNVMLHKQWCTSVFNNVAEGTVHRSADCSVGVVGDTKQIDQYEWAKQMANQSATVW